MKNERKGDPLLICSNLCLEIMVLPGFSHIVTWAPQGPVFSLLQTPSSANWHHPGAQSGLSFQTANAQFLEDSPLSQDSGKALLMHFCLQSSKDVYAHPSQLVFGTFVYTLQTILKK